MSAKPNKKTIKWGEGNFRNYERFRNASKIARVIWQIPGKPEEYAAKYAANGGTRGTGFQILFMEVLKGETSLEQLTNK